jgi:sirohydrochlorin ferrochelatase
MVSVNTDSPDRLSWRTTARRTAALINVLADDPRAAAVRRVLREHGEPDDLVVTDADVVRLQRAANRLRPLFGAEDLDQAVEVLNGLLARTHRLRLTDHRGASAWHPHLDSDDDAELAEWFLASSCFTMAVLIWDRQQRPGGICAADGCDRVFLATGSGPEQQYCSRRCATRSRVAAHRRRQLRPA